MKLTKEQVIIMVYKRLGIHPNEYYYGSSMINNAIIATYEICMEAEEA